MGTDIEEKLSEIEDDALQQFWCEVLDVVADTSVSAGAKEFLSGNIDYVCREAPYEEQDVDHDNDVVVLTIEADIPWDED